MPVTLTRLSCGHTAREGEPCIHPDHDVVPTPDRGFGLGLTVGLLVSVVFFWTPIIVAWAVTR